VFTSFEIGRRKPDRAAYEHVAEAIGTAPGRILFLDDVIENVRGARAAGMQAVHVRSPADVARAVAPWVRD
jgi:putative hydrolase of the HAD superfamily